MSKQNTKATIDANIKQNGRQAITGQILNGVLNTMVNDYAEQAETTEKLTDLERKVDCKTYGSEILAHEVFWALGKNVGDVAPTDPDVYTSDSFACGVIKVQGGDVVTITTKGGANARAYAVTDEQRVIKRISLANITLNSFEVEILEDGFFYHDCTSDYYNEFKLIHKSNYLVRSAEKANILYERLENKSIFDDSIKSGGYDFVNYIDNDISLQNIADGGYTLDGNGITVNGDNSNKRVFIDKKLLSLEYHISAVVVANNPTEWSTIRIGMYDFSSGEGVDSGSAMGLHYRNGTLYIYQAGSYLTSIASGKSVDNGDILLLEFIRYYDSFIGKVTNQTKGWTASVTYNHLFNYGESFLPPIYAKPYVQFVFGSFTLSHIEYRNQLHERKIKSISFGASLNGLFYSGTREGSWQFKLWNGSNRNHFQSLSFPGATIQTLESVLKEVVSIHPRYVTLMIGTNDVLQGKSLILSRSFYVKILDTLIDNGITPIMATIPPVASNKGNVTAINSMIRNLASYYGVKLVDVYSSFSASNLTADGVHPNADGHTEIANAFRSGAAEII